MVARWGLLLALLLLVLWVGGADGVYHQDLRWRAVWLHEDDAAMIKCDCARGLKTQLR